MRPFAHHMTSFPLFIPCRKKTLLDVIRGSGGVWWGSGIFKTVLFWDFRSNRVCMRLFRWPPGRFPVESGTVGWLHQETYICRRVPQTGVGKIVIIILLVSSKSH